MELDFGAPPVLPAVGVSVAVSSASVTTFMTMGIGPFGITGNLTSIADDSNPI